MKSDKKRILSIVLILIISCLTEVSADIWRKHLIITDIEARGGFVNKVKERIDYARKKGVVIDLPQGDCVSSCTLYTALLPDGLLCKQGEVNMVFHEFFWAFDIVSDSEGKIVSYVSKEPVYGLTKLYLWWMYPRHVRSAILQLSPSGLPPLPFELQIQAELLGVPECR